MKTSIATLRKIATRLEFSVYSQGSGWVLSSRETENLSHTVKTERAALLVGLERALERDMLTTEEAASVLAA